MKNKQVETQDWGLIDYKEAWDRQEKLFGTSVQLKTEIRNRQVAAINGAEVADDIKTPNYLVFCQHPHVYTLGKSGKAEHLLLDEAGLAKHQAVYYPINRGGDITYHGPGQLVVYPILDLDNFFTDIHLYLRTLEEAVIQTLAHYGVKAGRYPGYTGVWLDADNENARKICAMGVRCSRWVTMHGLALNVNADLSYFGYIVPCGIEGKSVASLQQELGREVDMNEVKEILKREIFVQFGMEVSDENNKAVTA
ncbi:lipoyl(octanoyl) transferase LipB [Mucilaginibacter sp. CSA2-8R]|uniref:lipoyl(octanoyl) transferase LipB n=1 Tax=Mucilaginibacter sp. CSA2-8R TaxID=3141542 RepID=UPI00315C5C07